jgi:hypothetical protein
LFQVSPAVVSLILAFLGGDLFLFSATGKDAAFFENSPNPQPGQPPNVTAPLKKKKESRLSTTFFFERKSTF